MASTASTLLDTIDTILSEIDDSFDSKTTADLEKPSANDILQIQNCINRFVQCIDDGDAKAMSESFVEDGVIELAKFNKFFTNREAIAGFCNTLHEKFKGTTHWESNIVIDFSKDRKTATNKSYWKAIKENQIMSYGLHKDTFIKDKNGNWLFQRRIIQHLWSKPN